jgi:ABC-type lipoprotein release transport system permease subunit
MEWMNLVPIAWIATLSFLGLAVSVWLLICTLVMFLGAARRLAKHFINDEE